jgi:hypothetical protein
MDDRGSEGSAIALWTVVVCVEVEIIAVHVMAGGGVRVAL